MFCTHEVCHGLRQPPTAQRQPRGQGADEPHVRRTPLGREAVQGDAHAAMLLSDLGQSPMLLLLVAGQQGSRARRSARVLMGFGEGESGGGRSVHLARGRARVLP